MLLLAFVSTPVVQEDVRYQLRVITQNAVHLPVALPRAFVLTPQAFVAIPVVQIHVRCQLRAIT